MNMKTAFLLLFSASAAFAALPTFEGADRMDLPAARVKPGKAQVMLDVAFAKGWHLNPDAPLQYSLDGAKMKKVKPAKLPVTIAYETAGRNALDLGVIIAYCKVDKSVCKQKKVVLHQPFTADPAAPSKLTLKLQAD